jgi:hypothetical protein
MEHRLNDTGQEKTELVLLKLGWDGIRACAVRALPVNTRTMARLYFLSLKFLLLYIVIFPRQATYFRTKNGHL